MRNGFLQKFQILLKIGLEKTDSSPRENPKAGDFPQSTVYKSSWRIAKSWRISRGRAEDSQLPASIWQERFDPLEPKRRKKWDRRSHFTRSFPFENV